LTQAEAPSTSVTPSPSWREKVDADLDALQGRATDWARLPLRRKIELLEGLRERTAAQAQRWVELATEAKGLKVDSPLAGEEWTSGPWALLYGVNRLVETLASIEKTGEVHLSPGSVRTRPDGQLVVEVFPQSAYDKLLLSGIRAEVWMEPGVTAGNLQQNMAAFYRRKDPEGVVSLVLGASNVASIAPLDVLYKLYAEGSGCLLKMNPVNDYLGPVLEAAFAEFTDAGYVATVYGGADVGAYVAEHSAVDEIHITGSARSHDVILFGPGPEGDQRKRDNRPRTAKRMTSELGNVSPTIVVPGPWSDADVKFQAAHLATQKMHNGGFNCIAAQVVVLPEGWEQGPKLVEAVEQVLGETPRRKAYYPGARDRQRTLVAPHPDAFLVDQPPDDNIPRTVITGLDSAADDEVCFQVEAFASVLAVTNLPGGDPGDYLERAIEFANTRLWGTLGANILVHPTTIKALGSWFEDAIAKLRYGCIAINSWTGVGFLLAQASWGAFPGHTPDDIQSGIGVVAQLAAVRPAPEERHLPAVLPLPSRPAPRPDGDASQATLVHHQQARRSRRQRPGGIRSQPQPAAAARHLLAGAEGLGPARTRLDARTGRCGLETRPRSGDSESQRLGPAADGAGGGGFCRAFVA
jgi:acyl-CoA reductase-like NAD-dependent aldehyde dehydrogenase